MWKRKFDELVSYFNRAVSEMEIGTEHKMTLLGMVTALGLAHEEEVRRKTGRWIDFSTMSWTGWHCSECDYETRRNSPYCPNCGAKMEGGK